MALLIIGLAAGILGAALAHLLGMSGWIVLIAGLLSDCLAMIAGASWLAWRSGKPRAGIDRSAGATDPRARH